MTKEKNRRTRQRDQPADRGTAGRCAFGRYDILTAFCTTPMSSEELMKRTNNKHTPALFWRKCITFGTFFVAHCADGPFSRIFISLRTRVFLTPAVGGLALGTQQVTLTGLPHGWSVKAFELLCVMEGGEWSDREARGVFLARSGKAGFSLILPSNSSNFSFIRLFPFYHLAPSAHVLAT